jgi:hypothetical protein
MKRGEKENGGGRWEERMGMRRRQREERGDRGCYLWVEIRILQKCNSQSPLMSPLLT